MRSAVLLLLLASLLCAQEPPFAQADDAYAQGKLRDAENLYQQIATSHPDAQVQADAFLRLAWVQFSLNEKQQCLYAMEKALFLNPKLTVDPNIYNQEFYKIYEMAGLRRSLVSASAGEDPLGDRPVPVPPLAVPPKSLTLPPPPVDPLTVDKTTPFYIPLDNPVARLHVNLPGSIVFEGDVILTVLVDAQGTPQQARVHASDFPQYNDAILRQVLGWKFSPALKGGRAVATWTTVVIHFKSKYKWSVTASQYTPVGPKDPIPVFVPWGFDRDRIPPGWRDVKFKNAENIQDVDTLPDVRKWDLDLKDFEGHESIAGILRVGADGKPVRFRASRIQTPGLIPYLEAQLRRCSFTPPLSRRKPVEAFINVEIQVDYKLNAPRVMTGKNVKVNLHSP